MTTSMTTQNMTDMMREIMNAAGSSQWTDANLGIWCGMAHWKLWADLLGKNRNYRMQQVNVTEDTNGQFDLSLLNTGSGDSEQYYFHILTVAQPASPGAQVQFYYRQAEYDQFPNPQPNTSLPYVWYQFGSKVQVLPVAPGQGLQITTNWRPPRPDWLSATSVAVDFPEGYAQVVPWWAASMALVKGGNETQAAMDIRNTAELMRDDFLQEIGRISTWPIIARSFDNPEDWAGD